MIISNSENAIQESVRETSAENMLKVSKIRNVPKRKSATREDFGIKNMLLEPIEKILGLSVSLSLSVYLSLCFSGS